MRYIVVLQQHADGSYQATVPVLPGVVEVGPTREAALSAVEQALRATLTTTEFVAIDLPDQPAPPRHPWLATAGSFADDPSLEAMLQEIYAAREAE